MLAKLALTLACIIAVRALGRRWAPLLVPESRRWTLVGGIVGAAMGFLGAHLWPVGPYVAGLWPAHLLIGVSLGIILAGLAPYLRILLFPLRS